MIFSNISWHVSGELVASMLVLLHEHWVLAQYSFIGKHSMINFNSWSMCACLRFVQKLHIKVQAYYNNTKNTVSIFLNLTKNQVIEMNVDY